MARVTPAELAELDADRTRARRVFVAWLVLSTALTLAGNAAAAVLDRLDPTAVRLAVHLLPPCIALVGLHALTALARAGAIHRARKGAAAALRDAGPVYGAAVAGVLGIAALAVALSYAGLIEVASRRRADAGAGRAVAADHRPGHRGVDGRAAGAAADERGGSACCTRRREGRRTRTCCRTAPAPAPAPAAPPAASAPAAPAPLHPAAALRRTTRRTRTRRTARRAGCGAACPRRRGGGQRRHHEARRGCGAGAGVARRRRVGPAHPGRDPHRRSDGGTHPEGRRRSGRRTSTNPRRRPIAAAVPAVANCAVSTMETPRRPLPGPSSARFRRRPLRCGIGPDRDAGNNAYRPC